ncbi:hypothetical protein C8P66_11288 [Humitalea rosea]|uniref:Rhodanese domain-containing protein n=1 Tax=Humitalea rosea TaxID=990373 RepID=A0A2W7IGF5_9PROT|nr:chromate resistance protein ChrB domain-containing protein [Humitalea rosea]PZW45072.1 hypothetical protein C8P66_11288 [Humitalea rosea]
MPALTTTVPHLLRLIGTPEAPVLLDVRAEDDRAIDPRLLPASRCRDHATVAEWAPNYAGRAVVVACQHGMRISEGVAAALCQAGASATVLEGGFQAWDDAGGPLVRPDHMPPRDTWGRTLWVTQAEPKIDRVACPWLIRRFVDPEAVFLFLAPAEVEQVARRFGATPFDIEGVFWGHRGRDCTFDTMLDEFGLESETLERMADIVRRAGSGSFDEVPEAAGLLAASLGFSRMYRDDLSQLDAAISLYDAFYRWSRDVVRAVPAWPALQPPA